MEKKTKNGIIVTGVTLVILYFILRKKPIVNNLYVNPTNVIDDTFDQYNLVERTDKIKELKEYTKNNYGTPDFVATAERLGIEPWWTMANSYAKTEGLNYWYAAMKKNQPTFTWKRANPLLSDLVIDTKTGQSI
jgi:hypothetical protein